MSKPCVSAFGTVPSDSRFNNMYVTRNTTVCKNVSSSKTSNGSNVTTDGNLVITLDEQNTENGVYSIVPASGKTIFRFSAPIQYNTTLTFNVDNSQSLPGDQMVWIIANSKPASISLINLTQPTYFYKECGSLVDTYAIDASDPGSYGNARLAQYWAFDGTTWIYTSDTS